ncbi:MAG: glycosyltransferase, partial [Mariniphaga sp.]|nr:glycosyltransferase [Mariniphaga sp.]
FLIDEVFDSLKSTLIIAGKNPHKKIIKKSSLSENIKVIANPSFDKMQELIQNAQACVIPAFQATGLKLKLLTSLYSGRYCITNLTMVKNTGLENLCFVANSASEIKEAITKCSEKEFTKAEINERVQILNSTFSNKASIKRLLNHIL